MRGLTRIYDVRMAQFVLKIEKMPHIMCPRGSQDLRSPSLIMAPDIRIVERLPEVSHKVINAGSCDLAELKPGYCYMSKLGLILETRFVKAKVILAWRKAEMNPS